MPPTLFSCKAIVVGRVEKVVVALIGIVEFGVIIVVPEDNVKFAP